jgi:predicted GIY-YIG superfamily endonuclease
MDSKENNSTSNAEVLDIETSVLYNEEPGLLFADKATIDNKKFALFKYGANWPVVYLLYDKKTIYIGETCSIKNRYKQHCKNPEKAWFTNIVVISHSGFNKSATLDIEQSMIRFYKVDKKFKVFNKNEGQSLEHNYYQRERYTLLFREVWNALWKK